MKVLFSTVSDHFDTMNIPDEIVNRFWFLCGMFDDQSVLLNFIRCMHMALHDYEIDYEIEKYIPIIKEDLQILVEMLDLMDGFTFYVKPCSENPKYRFSCKLLPIKAKP